MKKKKNKDTNWIPLVVGGALSMLVIVLVCVLLMRKSDTDKALLLREKLLTADSSMQRQDRNQLFVGLARAVDRMNRDELRSLRQKVREDQQMQFESSMSDFLLAIGADKVAVLDRALEQWTRAQDVLMAVEGESQGGRGRQDARRSDDNNPTGGDVPGPSQVASAAEKVQRVTFVEALRKRAAERGIEFNAPRSRG